MHQPTADVDSCSGPPDETLPVASSMIDRRDIQRLLMTMAAGAVAICILRFITAEPVVFSARQLSGENASTTGFKVNVNLASVEELALLPQVGPILASRIVSEREKGGEFLTIEDLSRTPGIGPERAARLACLIEVKK